MASFLHSLRHKLGFHCDGTVHRYTGVDGKHHMGHFCEHCGTLQSGHVPMATPMKRALQYDDARSIFFHKCKRGQRCLRENLEKEGYLDEGGPEFKPYP